MLKTRLDASIGNGLRYLLMCEDDGRFDSALFHGGVRYRDSSPFVTALIGLNLIGVLGDRSRGLLNRAVAWLDGLRPDGDVWRYWEGAGGPHGLQVLRDTDDTAVVSLLFYLALDRTPDCVGMLLAQQNAEGRFGTWIPDDPGSAERALYPHCDNNAPDLVVNLNVSLLLELLGVRQRGVAEWAMGTVERFSAAEETSFYGVSAPYSVYQAIARNREMGVEGLDLHDECIVRDLERRWDLGHAWGSALSTALAVDTLCTVRGAPKLREGGVEALVGLQNNDGSWPTSPLYGAPERLDDGFGSEALTTAYAIRALFRAQEANTTAS